MSPIQGISAPMATFDSSPSMQQARRAGHSHSVIAQGNTSTSAGNGTGATQSFASILSSVTGALAK